MACGHCGMDLEPTWILMGSVLVGRAFQLYFKTHVGTYIFFYHLLIFLLCLALLSILFASSLPPLSPKHLSV